MIKGEISYTPLYREITLKGRILDENGRPIEGASVTVKNTNNGVASGNHGKYTINVKPGDVLSVSALGYLTTEITVTREMNMDIRMEKMSEPVIVAGMISIDWKQQRPDPVVVMEEISDSAAAKTIIDLIDSDSQSGFRVFPNPVVSGQYLSMQCSKIENGNYTLQWLDQSGRFIREESVQAASKNNLIRSYVPSVPAGSYFLVLSNKKSGKKFAQKIIVQ
jgi:hypothetical protein